MRSPVRIWLSAPRDHLCKQLCRGDFLFGTARGGRMTEGNRKQKRFRARQASVGDQRLFLKIPAGRFLRNHSRFYGAVSADPAGLFRSEGELRQILGDGSAKVFCAKILAAHGKGPPGCFRVTGRLLPRGDDRMPGLGRLRQKVETDSGHWEKRLCHLQTHAIDLYYAHGKEWARLHPMPDRPGKTIPCRR